MYSTLFNHRETGKKKKKHNKTKQIFSLGLSRSVKMSHVECHTDDCGDVFMVTWWTQVQIILSFSSSLVSANHI